MDNKRGKFIVLDGIDGSGKGEQIKRLAAYLFNKDKANHVFLTREPYNTKYGAEIRKILKENKNPKDKAEILAGLYVKDRIKHTEIIKKCLKLGHHVVSDRYKYSTLAYQQTQGIPLEKLMEMHQGVLVPDLTVIVDVPAKAAMERTMKDGNRTHLEVFEQIDFQEDLRNKYLELPEKMPDENIVIIDGNCPPEEVFRLIKTEVDKIL